jgi:His-Xaa-Ser system protein HxsD
MVKAVTVPVDTRAYPLEVIYGAAYVLMDRAYVHLVPAGGGIVDVRLAGKETLDTKGLRALGGTFANELVNQALRVTLDESGRKLREYIVAKAHFFQEEGGRDVQRLLDTTMQEAFDEDPLDIAVPWEEKYGSGGTEKS